MEDFLEDNLSSGDEYHPGDTSEDDSSEDESNESDASSTDKISITDKHGEIMELEEHHEKNNKATLEKEQSDRETCEDMGVESVEISPKRMDSTSWFESEKTSNRQEIASESKVYIKTAAKGKRIYDKLNSCFFCGKEYLKLGRHLQQVHSTEEEVEKALSYKVKDERRKQQFEKLCRMGNFNHNMKVLELKQGELKVVRRPSDNMDVNPDNYLPCKFCNVFFQKDELWRHAPKCPFQESDGNNVPTKRMQYEGRFLLGSKNFPTGCSKQLSENVISVMALDKKSADKGTEPF